MSAANSQWAILGNGGPDGSQNDPVTTATATDPAGNTSEFSDCSTEDTIFTDSLEGD